MRIVVSEEEAIMLILTALGLQDDATLKKRGDLHVLQSNHEVIIQSKNMIKTEEVPDDCFIVDGVKEDLEGCIDGET